MSSGSIGFDTTEIRAFARQVQGADKIVMDELTTAFDRSGATILSAAKGNIHNKSGELSGSGKKTTTVSSSTIETLIAFTAKHAQWVEWGRGPVVAIRAKALAFEIGGETIFRKSVGPAKAQKFLGRAFDSNKDAIVRAVDAAAARIVAKVLA